MTFRLQLLLLYVLKAGSLTAFCCRITDIKTSAASLFTYIHCVAYYNNRNLSNLEKLHIQTAALGD
jgi:hypothetical protein